MFGINKTFLNMKKLKMLTIVLLLLLAFFLSCQSQNVDYSQSIAGEYVAVKPKRRLIGFNRNYYVLNTILNIQKDKTFEIQTCSYKATGKWFISKDTFHYKYDTLIWLIDSLNDSKNYASRKNNLIKYNRYFIIKNNMLYHKIKEGKKNLIKKLVKNND